MSLRVHLLLSLSVMGLLLIYPALYGLTQLVQIRDVAERLEGPQAQAAGAVGKARTALAELDRHQRAYIIAGDSLSRRSMWLSLQRAEEALGTLESIGYAEPGSDLAVSVEGLAGISARVDSLMVAGATRRATTYFQSVKQAFDETDTHLQEVSAVIQDESAQALSETGGYIAAAQSTLGRTALLALCFAIGFALWMVRSIRRPIRHLRDAMAGVASGDFSVPETLPYGRRDEIGDASRSFRSMTAELAKLQRLRAEFVSMASHELKNPLNVIGGYAEILDEGQFGELNDEQRRSLRTINDQVSVLSRLVNQLLDLGRYEAGALDLQRDAVSVPDLLEGVVRSFETLGRQRGIDLAIEIATSAPAVVWGDVDRLRNEVLGNLVSNAVKFTPGGGKVTVAAASDHRGLRVEVRDTGEGISPEHRPLVFEKFYQGQTPARALGAGLGLAIAREMVVAHGGEIGVESKPGRGATFWFTIPLRVEDFSVDSDIVPIGRARRAG
ncbi:MAG: sensor histidine kinase [Gemmatimonadota bacterium]